MADIVSSVLELASKKEAQYKTIEVNKAIEPEIDGGNLLILDPSPLDIKLIRSDKDVYLCNTTRDSIQLLFNKLWNLPHEKVENAVVVELPDTTTLLPREKPIPAKRKLTRWEEYAKIKGIQKRKKSRMEWDDPKQEWRPRWGYKSARAEKEWLLEVPANADPFEDQFAKKAEAKKERVAKNELQRLRNIARRMKGKVPGVGLTPVDQPDKDHLQHALLAARTSDASVGRFSQRVKGKEKKYMAKSGKKRKFDSNIGNSEGEKTRSLKILDSITSKTPILNIQRAVGRHIASEQQQRWDQPDSGKKKGKKGAAGKGSSSKNKHAAKKSPYAKRGGQFKKGGGGVGKGKGTKK